jgi:hypothetical protein
VLYLTKFDQKKHPIFNVPLFLPTLLMFKNYREKMVKFFQVLEGHAQYFSFV